MNQPLSQSPAVENEIKDLLSKLQAYGYRATRPLIARTQYNQSLPTKLVKAIILDTETTGIHFDPISRKTHKSHAYCCRLE